MHADPIQNEIEGKGLNAPRVHPEDLEAEIIDTIYFTAQEAIGTAETRGIDAYSRLTFCVLALKNGSTVVGTSACVSPENFDVAIGRKIARKNAVEQLWPLLGFRLADKIATGISP